MASKVAEKVGFGSIVVASFVVGMLIGASYCQPPGPDVTREGGGFGGGGTAELGGASSRCEPRIVEKLVESPPKIIYECPPEPEPEVKPGVAEGKKREDPKRALPEPEPELDPLERKRLLAWVRERSVDLKRCRDDSKEIYRVAVVLYLDKKTRQLKRVDVNGDKAQLPQAVSGCLRQEILRWEPPAELTKQRTKIVFGLNL